MARRESCRLHMARPRLAGCAARRLATLVLLAFRASCYDRPRVVRLHPGPRLAAHAEYEVSWTATDLGTADEAWIEFDLKHYQSMVNDGPRTALFLDELERRLAAYPPFTATVLDLGTGPFALFAKAAARLGARKVYAIEAVPASAARAREEVSDAAKYGREFAEGVVEVLEGFSTDVALPEKVDLVIFEIAGSIASEEGCYATMRDARDRFLARPDDASSYIPHAYQTLGAPATDLCHHGGGVEDPGAPVLRVQSDDATLRLLADPLLVEDIVFSAPLPARGAVPPASELAWAVDGARVDANEAHFAGLLEPDRAAVEANGYDVADLARDVATTLTGVALWPRLVFDAGGERTYETRGPRGEMRRSHWPTVLPPLAPAPGVRVRPGDVLTAAWEADLRDGAVDTPIVYSLACDVAAPGGAGAPAPAGGAQPYAAWAAATDAGSGRTYYYNAETGATSWDWPPREP